LTGDPAAENSLQRPVVILPREEAVGQFATGQIESVGSHSFVILRIPTRVAAP
jgi:hypothetical protein